ncbi:MAG: BTAD domain-containing putative transcriptional regulator, partial [Acidimicrobiia bacterium]
MDFRLLGPLEVVSDGIAIEIPAPKQRSLLGLLLLHAGDVITSDRILEELWGDDQPSSGASAVRFHMSKLRDALLPDRPKGDDGIIVTRPPGYLLPGDGHHIDIHDFDLGVERARSILQTDPGRASDQLREALALWRGRALSDFQYEQWAQPEIARLEELRLGAVEDRIDADLAMGRHGDVTGELEAMVAEHPFRERFARQLMLALYRAGRQAEALRAYQRTREALVDQLGVEPSPDLQRVEQRILDQDESLLDVVDSAPSRTRAVRGYELRQKVDEGQFGVIYRGYQPAVGREVAVKVIKPEYANLPDFIRRFETEAQVVARLEHPHIIPLYDYWREPDGAYLVMRWLRGGSLGDALAHGTWSLPATARLAEQIGAALAVAHRAGVVHRDVKPGNILLDAEGNAYLSDFGIAKDLEGRGDAKTTGGVPLGSPGYMAPEQLSGE